MAFCLFTEKEMQKLPFTLDMNEEAGKIQQKDFITE